MSLTKEEILAFDDAKCKKVDVPEWGSFVHVKVLSGAERDAFEVSCYGDEKVSTGRQNIRAKLCSLAMCDEKGTRLFNGEKDAIKLGKKSSLALDRVFLAASQLNGFSESEIDELAKNLEGSQPDDSSIS